VLLIDGALVPVPGVKILAPRGEAWNYLAKGNKRTLPVQAKILHKTIADDPEKLDENPPTAHYARFWGYAKLTLDWWHKPGVDASGKPKPPLSGTQLVTGHDGSTVCTEDLVRFVGWQANQANERTWGHEIKEYVGGLVHRAALAAAVAITKVDTSAIGVQWQCPRSFTKPLARWNKSGGVDLVGVFGHRDVTTQRSRHDPGDEVFAMLEREGFERFDFAAGEDLDVWGKRQQWLRGLGLYDGAIDGVPFTKTRLALQQLGFPAGIFARWRELAELPPMPPGWSP
jgi:hypothetical protein